MATTSVPIQNVTITCAIVCELVTLIMHLFNPICGIKTNLVH